jgi:hypothetical protein
MSKSLPVTEPVAPRGRWCPVRAVRRAGRKDALRRTDRVTPRRAAGAAGRLRRPGSGAAAPGPRARTTLTQRVAGQARLTPQPGSAARCRGRGGCIREDVTARALPPGRSPRRAEVGGSSRSSAGTWSTSSAERRNSTCSSRTTPVARPTQTTGSEWQPSGRVSVPQMLSTGPTCPSGRAPSVSEIHGGQGRATSARCRGYVAGCAQGWSSTQVQPSSAVVVVLSRPHSQVARNVPAESGRTSVTAGARRAAGRVCGHRGCGTPWTISIRMRKERSVAVPSAGRPPLPRGRGPRPSAA